MTPTALGEQLAHLVWESFGDMLTDEDGLKLLERVGVLNEDGSPNARASEEALIFLLWAHTRGIQQASLEQRAGAGLTTLDVLHRAVYQDMVANGVNPGELPIFEERVRARYARYAQAARESDVAVGSAVLAAMTGRPSTRDDYALRVASLAVSVMAPLSDFYTALEFVEE